MMAIRIQRKRSKGWKMPEGAVYVGRPTIWGNPFPVHSLGVRSHEEGKIREASIAKYRNYLPRLLMAQPGISLEHLRGKDLACWCRLDQPCHADVLLELANYENGGLRE